MSQNFVSTLRRENYPKSNLGYSEKELSINIYRYDSDDSQDRKCKVSQTYVSNIRKEVTKNVFSDNENTEDISNLGRREVIPSLKDSIDQDDPPKPNLSDNEKGN